MEEDKQLKLEELTAMYPDALKDILEMEGIEQQNMLFIAQFFFADIKTNLYLSSIDLNEKHKIGLSKWREFLQIPSIKDFIYEAKNEILDSEADKSLLYDTNKNSNIKFKEYVERNSAGDRTGYIITRIPPRYEINTIQEV